MKSNLAVENFDSCYYFNVVIKFKILIKCILLVTYMCLVCGEEFILFFAEAQLEFVVDVLEPACCVLIGSWGEFFRCFPIIERGYQ